MVPRPKSVQSYENSDLRTFPVAQTASSSVMAGGIVLLVKNPGGVLTGPNYGTGDCFVKIVVLYIVSSLPSVASTLATPLMLSQTLLSLL